MVLKAVVKALKKADRLKEKIQNHKDLLNDNDTWVTQQQLQRVYQQVLILDLEYALDKKVEQELWNHGFKNFIGNLQTLAKDKKNPNHAESQAMLYWCLEAASGFYLTLLHEICSAFDLDLPFRRKGNVFGCNKNVSSLDSHCQPNKSSCYYICQHCLVHLGDIARYRNQNKQAEAFYRYAVQLSPSSGQPYNQLAILEASRGDKLSTVYHYVRSVALRHPFPVASTNLSRTLHKHAEEVVKFEGHSKLSSGEYVATFLKLHGLLHSNNDLDTAEKLIQVLTTSLTAQIATESLSSWKLVQIVTINIFALHNAGGGIDWKSKTFSENELAADEQRIKLLITDFLAACLTAFLLPVYTFKPGEPLLEYFAMPAVKLTLEWIKQEPEVLEKSSFKNRLQIWPSLCKVLNDMQPIISDFPGENYAHVPLPEDRDLQGFLPFEKCFQTLKFYTEDLKIDNEALNKLRAYRIVDFGVWLSQQNGLNIITCSKDSVAEEGSCTYRFEATGRQEPPSGDQIKEIEEMILTKLPSPTPSEVSGSVTGASTPDSSGFFSSVLANPFLKLNSSEFSSQENLQEKRPGILKCQNSGEKMEKGVKASTNRGQRNVALQALINRHTEETKQVTFRTPSPQKEIGPVHSPKKSSNFKRDESKYLNSEDSKKDKKFIQQSRDHNGSKMQNKLLAEENESPKHGDASSVRGARKQGRTEPEGKMPKKKEKSKELPFTEFMAAFPPLPGAKETLKNANAWSSEGSKEIDKEEEKGEDQKNFNKQQLLSELFSKDKSPDVEQKQPQNLSGLLNLSKQQQKMLTDSKLLNNRSQQGQLQQSHFLHPQVSQVPNVFDSDLGGAQANVAIQKLKYVDKMEAARKEYEAAMFALQKNQSQESQRLYPGPEPDLVQYDFDRRMNLQQHSAPPPQVQPQNQVYVRMNQPLINVGNFGYKYPAQFYLPWQEPQEPPLPPSWWSDTSQNHHQSQQVDLHDRPPFPDPLSRRDEPLLDFDWTYQPYSINFPIYVPPAVMESAREDFRIYQVQENFASGPPAGVPREHAYPQSGSGMQPFGVGGSSYSLFSTSSWNTFRGGDDEPEQNGYALPGGIMAQQSFWSGPGPSPLERLLEQQKQMRKAEPDPKNGT